MTISRAFFAAAVFVPFLAAAPAQSQPAPQQIDVSLTSYAFTPATLNLKAGTPYRLHLTNNASKGHDFSAPEFFAASTIDPADAAKVDKGEIEVDEGQSVDVTVTPMRAGSYPLACTHFMHSMMGMKGEIVVQ